MLSSLGFPNPKPETGLGATFGSWPCKVLCVLACLPWALRLPGVQKHLGPGEGLGFRVQGLGFRVEGLGFRV